MMNINSYNRDKLFCFLIMANKASMAIDFIFIFIKGINKRINILCILIAKYYYL